MAKNKLMTQIYKDFLPIMNIKEITGLLLFGSHATNQQTNRSDIDICIVAPNTDNHRLFLNILTKINVNPKNYDIHMFSELPIHIKIQIIEKGILVYSPNQYDLYEYFYFYRKLWNDQNRRQELTKEELLAL